MRMGDKKPCRNGNPPRHENAEDQVQLGELISRDQ